MKMLKMLIILLILTIVTNANAHSFKSQHWSKKQLEINKKRAEFFANARYLNARAKGTGYESMEVERYKIAKEAEWLKNQRAKERLRYLNICKVTGYTPVAKNRKEARQWEWEKLKRGGQEEILPWYRGK